VKTVLPPATIGAFGSKVFSNRSISEATLGRWIEFQITVGPT
jgi:hypothetical protein